MYSPVVYSEKKSSHIHKKVPKKSTHIHKYFSKKSWHIHNKLTSSIFRASTTSWHRILPTTSWLRIFPCIAREDTALSYIQKKIMTYPQQIDFSHFPCIAREDTALSYIQKNIIAYLQTIAKKKHHISANNCQNPTNTYPPKIAKTKHHISAINWLWNIPWLATLYSPVIHSKIIKKIHKKLQKQITTYPPKNAKTNHHISTTNWLCALSSVSLGNVQPCHIFKKNCQISTHNRKTNHHISNTNCKAIITYRVAKTHRIL